MGRGTPSPTQQATATSALCLENVLLALVVILFSLLFIFWRRIRGTDEA